ncbi:MAG: TonB-dependent receptor [Acidobacteria bacterium]|nr:TonB-dependent receptor [Acidobacteriota bacterium]
MKTWGIRTAAFVLVSVFMFGQHGFSQATTATISGTVADSSRAVLPGATVVILHEETGISRTVRADAAGRYSAPSLALGSYRVTASLEGFQSEARSGIVLTIGRQAVVNFELQVGAVTQTVEVTGEAPLVETTQSSVDFLVNDTTVRELPLNGRDITQLILLNPGVAQVDNDTTGSVTYIYGKVYSFSGFRPYDNLFLLDGTEINQHNNVPPAGASGSLFGAETVQEFVVKSSGFSAAYGRTLGGVVNAVTKSGTNTFHGSVFEYLRNSALDARNFFDRDPSKPTVRSDPPPFRRNQFGGSVGGPIVRDKSFFFTAYEGLRQSRTDSATYFVPDSNLRQGIFSAVPREQVAPIALRYLALYPPSNGRPVGEGIAEFLYGTSQRAQDDFGQGRMDYQISPNNSLFGRFTYANSSFAQNPFPGYVSTSEMLTRLLTLSETHIFSPRLLNTFRFGFSRTVPRDRGTYPNWPQDLISNPDEKATPRINPGGGLTALSFAGTSPDLGFWTNRFEYIDDVTLSLGPHTLQFGGNFQRAQYNYHYPEFSVSDWGFGGIANFLRIRPTSYRGTPERFGDFWRGFRQNFLGLYVQDDWQVRPNLTLNLGLRYDLGTVPKEHHGRIANLRKVSDVTPTAGDPYYNNGGKLDFSHRFGFAWSPFGDSKTSVRGGFGMFYHRVDMATYWVAAMRNGSLSPVFRIQNPTGQFFPNAIATIQASLPIGQGVEYMHFGAENGVQTPYAMSWNLTAQRQLGNSTVISAGYAANRGVDLSYTTNVNQPRAEFVNGFLTIPQGATLQNPAWSDILFYGTGVNSWYHALQINAQKRMAAGLQFQLSYTFSKALSEADAATKIGPFQGAGNDAMRYSHDRKVSKSWASFDVRNLLTANYVYELPFGPGKPWLSQGGVMGHLFGGWELNGIITLKNGQPLGIEMSAPRALSALRLSVVPNQKSDFSRDAITWGAPNVSQDPTGQERYFNPDAYEVPGPRQIGNVGRYTLINPGVANWDLGLSKNFQVTEQMRVQFRSEFFNLLNRANFATPSFNLFDANGRPDPTAGRITRTTTHSREIQFGLKLIF